MAEAKHGADWLLKEKIAKILEETKTSYATHNRKLKEMLALRSKSESVVHFCAAFVKTLTPLFTVQRRTGAAERVVRFVSAFASARDPNNVSQCNAFLEEFLRVLLAGAAASNRTARSRACQILSEIILRLPDDAEVRDELIDELIEFMKLRVWDKVPVIRAFAVRTLSRFVNDSENSDILDLLLEVLPQEQNAEVRKTIVLSLPPSDATSPVIIDCTLDVSEAVRKAAYCVIASKFPLQSLSIKHRATVLRRGLADRSPNVLKECLKLLKEQWLSKCCKDDPVELLRYLDVETYESVGESVMEALLKEGLVKLHGDKTIQQYISSDNGQTKGDETQPVSSIQPMGAEVALFWRLVCRHLYLKAQAKGLDAAATMGAEAAVYAAEASESNDLLEQILPQTVSDYVGLVKAHIDAGPSYYFTSRQLLLLGAILDFSDAILWKAASSFVQDLLHRPLEHEVDEAGNKVVIGDGINLGGDRNWANAVSILAKKVHSGPGEFEEVVLGIVEELARPCRERTADFTQWMHMLSVTGFLLENTKSLNWFQGKAIEPDEILHALLLPGVKHIHLDVQRVAIRCLGLLALLENKPREEIVKQLRIYFSQGPAPVRIMACKALLDLVLWHGPREIDEAMGRDLSSQLENNVVNFSPVNFAEVDEADHMKILDLVYTVLEADESTIPVESDENESVQAVLGETFAKLLLLGEKYPSVPITFHPILLSKLITLFFSEASKEQHRLRQCLSVFFEHYSSLSVNHKGHLSKAFALVVRSMWPGINGNAGGSSIMVSNMRKRAVQASKFMLEMMKAPLYNKDNGLVDESGGETGDGSTKISFDKGEEGLAIRLAAEVLSFRGKRTAAEKAYITALCRILILLDFRSSQPDAIKVMRRLLSLMALSVSTEKDLGGELKRMAKSLEGVDTHPDQELTQDQANSVFERLGLDFNLDMDDSTEVAQTPAPCSTKTARPRRRVTRNETSSDEEDARFSAQSIVPTAVRTSVRSYRASKAAALVKLTATRTENSNLDEDEEEGSSEVTVEGSDESDHGCQ